MTDGKVRRTFPYRVILSTLMGVIILYLVISFITQIGVSLELRAKRHGIEQDVAAAEQTNAQLKAELEYVSSDRATEQWARENGWAKPDEVLVVLLAPDAQGSPGDELPQDGAVRPVADVRDTWWDLFFGER